MSKILFPGNDLTWQVVVCTVLQYLQSNSANDIEDISKLKILEGIKPMISKSMLVDEKIGLLINTIRYYESERLSEEIADLIDYLKKNE